MSVQYGTCERCGRMAPPGRTRCDDCDADDEWSDTGRAAGLSPLRTIRFDTDVLGRRVGAAFLDFVPVALFLVWLAYINGIGQFMEGRYMVEMTSSRAVVALGVTMGYYLVQETVTSTSLGKRMLGLVVVDDGGRRLGPARAAVRTALRAIDILPVLYVVGFVAASSDTSRRRIGDRIAGTLVVAMLDPDDDPPPADADVSYPQRPTLVQTVFLAVMAAAMCLAGLLVLNRAP